jgi:hypothetical protein
VFLIVRQWQIPYTPSRKKPGVRCGGHDDDTRVQARTIETRPDRFQIEGFFFYLFAGFFAGSVIHYMVAKVFGPIIFGRGWCGWACWTAVIPDLLPYTKNREGRVSASWEKLRYVHFAFSLSMSRGGKGSFQPNASSVRHAPPYALKRSSLPPSRRTWAERNSCGEGETKRKREHGASYHKR